MAKTSQEKNYQDKIIQKYFRKYERDIEVDRIDAIFYRKKDDVRNPILLVEFKFIVKNETDIYKALVQLVLTVRKSNKHYGCFYGVIAQYQEESIFYYFEHNDFIFNTNAINIENETPNNPSIEAINNLAPILEKEIKIAKSEQLQSTIDSLMSGNPEITITEHNVVSIFQSYMNRVPFEEKLTEEQMIDIFITDIYFNAEYKRVDKGQNPQFPTIETNWQIVKVRDKTAFKDKADKLHYLKDDKRYNEFWTLYHRPPTEKEFSKIYENRHLFFSESYRKKVGGYYTPEFMVDFQNEVLKKHLGDDFETKYIILDVTAGTGNLQEKYQNKDNVYLSTLDEGDVLIAKSKGFSNVKQWDIFKGLPTFNYGGNELPIDGIAKHEKKQILVIMNPPYEEEKYFRILNKLAESIKNFHCYWYSKLMMFERKDFLQGLQNLKVKIIDNYLFSAKETFKLANWGLCCTLFEFNENITKKISDEIELKRYECKKNPPTYKENVIINPFKKTFKESLNLSTQSLVKLGIYMKFGGTRYIFANYSDNKNTKTFITPDNWENVLLLVGIYYNSDKDYWEYDIEKEPEKELSNEFKADLILTSLLYTGNGTYNKENAKNYFVPFTEQELGIPAKHLYIEVQNKPIFDFREKLKPFKDKMSMECKVLYNSVLQIYRFYLNRFEGDADMNAGWLQIRDALKNDTAKPIEYMKTKPSITGKSRALKGKDGITVTWVPSKLDKKYGTKIFTEYDNALLKMFEKIQDGMIEHGIIKQRMSCLR